MANINARIEDEKARIASAEAEISQRRRVQNEPEAQIRAAQRAIADLEAEQRLEAFMLTLANQERLEAEAHDARAAVTAEFDAVLGVLRALSLNPLSKAVLKSREIEARRVAGAAALMAQRKADDRLPPIPKHISSRKQDDGFMDFLNQAEPPKNGSRDHEAFLRAAVLFRLTNNRFWLSLWPLTLVERERQALRQGVKSNRKRS